jgi:hypothetical protein
MGYADFHLQFKPGYTDRFFIIGVTPSPANTIGTNFAHQIYCDSAGNAHAYGNSTALFDMGSYTVNTVFGIIRRDTTIEFYKDGSMVYSTPATFTGPAYLFASLYNQTQKITNVAFGPGTTFEVIDTSEITPNAATEVVSAFAGGGVLTYGAINGAINDTRAPLSAAISNNRNESVIVDVSYKALVSIASAEPSGISRYLYLNIITYDTATVTDQIEVYTEDAQGGYFSDKVTPGGLPRSGSIPILLPPGRTLVGNVRVALRAVSGIYPSVPNTIIRDRALTLTAMKR